MSWLAKIFGKEENKTDAAMHGGTHRESSNPAAKDQGPSKETPEHSGHSGHSGCCCG